MTVAIGRKLPAFALPATGGTTWKSGDAAGEKLVLYFYPRDNTPGCTREGQAFAEHHAKFRRAGARVVGISRDSIAAHEKFKAQMKLPFELLSDVDEKACKLFDVIREKVMYGRRMLGVERSTFLFDATGVLRREWRKVKVDGHAEEVLEAAKSL